MKFKLLMLFSLVLIAIMALGAVNAANETVTVEDSQDSQLSIDQTEANGGEALVDEVAISDVSNLDENDNSLRQPNNEINSVRDSPVIITPENYKDYLEYGTFIVEYDNVVFKGNFSNIELDHEEAIIVAHSANISGDGAIFNNICFHVHSSNVTIENITFIYGGAGHTNALINVYEDNVKLNNLNINYTLVDNDCQVNVIYFNSKRNINLTNSKIFFENHATRDATKYMNALNIYECQDILIDNNTFNSRYPFLTVENYNQEYYMMGLSYINPICIYEGNNIKFTNNYVNTTPNNHSGSYPTLQSLYIVGSHDCLIEGNKFFMIDNLTPIGANNYLYGINFGYNHNLTMSNNEFLMFTKGGIDSNGAAYPFQGVESEVKIIGNKIKSISNGPNLGIYVASMSGGSSELYIADNFINITGLAVTHAWALVSGIEIQNGHAAIYNNTIYTYNIGEYDDNNNIYGISYAQFMYGDRSFDIRNNTIFTEGKYAISIIKTDNSNVTNNYLVAHELDGDDCVIIKNGVNNLILNNEGIKSKVNMTINAANVFMGSNATISVTLNSENVTGNISLIINGVNITKAIENSNVQFNISNLILGVNNFIIAYSGDEKYKSCKINSSLKCLDGIVNNVTFHDYFDETGNLLDIVPNGATLDFRGNFIASADANYTIAILKPINMISTTKDAFIDLHTSAGSLFGENPGNRFAIYNGGSGTNVSDIIFHNTQVWVENAHHVILNNISAIVEDARVGSGVGATSIRGNSSYVTVKNSYFYTRNNGGSSSLVIAGANYCIFDNNTVRGVGNVGNLIYLTTYNTGLPTGSIANIGNTIINNKMYGPDTPTAICWGFVITGVNTTFANNYINYSGTGVNPQWGASNTNNLTICNNTLVGGASMNLPANTYAYNNTVSGSLTVSSGSIIYNSTANALYISVGGKAINITVAGNTAINGANTQLSNSILNGSVSFGSSAKNTTFINNTVFNAVGVQSDNNVICGNIIKTVDTYAIVLGSKKNNNVTENYLYARSKYGDNAVSYSDSSNIVKDNCPIGVTNSTFFNFFDSNGVLLNNNSYDELVFLGDFSGLGVNIINLNRNISILGSNAVLYDMGFLISASGVVLNSLTLSSTVNNFAGNGGAVVLVNGIGVVLSNLDIVCNVGNVADIFAVVANDSNGLIFKNSKISFTVLANGNKISIPVKIDNSNDTIIENNTVVAFIPSYDIEWSLDPVTYEYAPKAKSEGFLIKKSKGVKFKDNNILINVNNKIGTYNTMYGLHAMLCNDLEVSDNKIEVNGSKYAYATIISGQNINIKNNNIHAHTDDYYAAAIDLEGPATAYIDSNNLTAKSNHVVYVIYSGGFMGRIEAEYTNNNLTGESRFTFGTSLTGVTENFINNTIILNGNYTMAITGNTKYLQIINNTIQSNGTNIGPNDGSGDTVITNVETTGIIIVKQLGNANITNNNIKSTGNYTVITEREGNVIKNHLIANKLVGDDSVKATNNNTTIENNTPFKTGLIITINDVKYKQKFTIIANLTHKINGEVIATINNKNYTINIVNGSGSLVVNDILPVGKYLVSAKYNGNQNYLPTTNTTTFNITKATLNISAIVSDVVYGQDLVVYHVLNVGDAVGSVVYFVDGEMVGNSSVGSSINVSGLKAGLHTVFVKLVDEKQFFYLKSFQGHNAEPLFVQDEDCRF